MTHSDVDREPLIARLAAHVASQPEIVFAVLHGSFAHGEPYHDIDVAVWLDPARVKETDWQRYALDAATGLTVTVRVPIDIQVLNGAPLAFRHHALKGIPLLVRDQDLFDDVRARTWDDYFDFLPFARQYLREALGA